jgi:xanthine/CO dehydrogenase XdhC/CoxF family maturation factor
VRIIERPDRPGARTIGTPKTPRTHLAEERGRTEVLGRQGDVDPVPGARVLEKTGDKSVRAEVKIRMGRREAPTVRVSRDQLNHHDPKLDDAVLKIALRSDAQFIGAMGSRRAQERRRDRLLAQGISDDELGRLSAPIGLDIGALTAEETAISILGEITAVRRGREGGRLITAKGRIHDASADEAPRPATASS